MNVYLLTLLMLLSLCDLKRKNQRVILKYII
ncbi:hypothetical protein F888_02031 [Acinetobacter courvalinii]|uniref:Uncharacterized protein n=1 Tax=Acinetobacter courvalinii TaxID=280147 RepID=N9R694_9GAMM|nr:hypothetical protein F888_02031 [Acinetobacter courvalinii]